MNNLELMKELSITSPTKIVMLVIDGLGGLEAVGIDIELQAGDVAARGNFCTVDEKGIITDRRAGRISTEKSTELCRLLDGMSIEGARVFVHPAREHRFGAVFRVGGL